MKLAIAVGIALGIVGTGVAFAEVITSDTAITASSSDSTFDIRSLQVTSPSNTQTAPSPDASKLPSPGVLTSGSITPSSPKGSAGGAESNPVTPNTVPTPGAISLMAMSAVTILGRGRRAPAGR